MDIMNEIIDSKETLQRELKCGLSKSKLLQVRESQIADLAEGFNLPDTKRFVKFIKLSEGNTELSDSAVKEWAYRFSRGAELDFVNESQKKVLNHLTKITEGVVPDVSKDDEETIVKKLTEEEEPQTDEEQEDALDDVEDVVVQDQEDEETQLEKEYFGTMDDNFFYIISTSNDEDVPDDLQIVDAEGEKVFSAVDNDIDPTDLITFIKEAVKEINMTDISYEVFAKYLLPLLIQDDEEEVEDEMEVPDDMEDEPTDDFEEAEVPYESRAYKVTPLECKKGSFKFSIGDKVFTLSEKFVNIYSGNQSLSAKELMETMVKDVLKQCDEETLARLASKNYVDVPFSKE